MENPEKLAAWGAQDVEKHTICIEHYYTQTNINNVNKTWAPLQATVGKDEPNMFGFLF